VEPSLHPLNRAHPGGAAGPHPARTAARTRIRWEKTTAVAVKIKLKRLGKIRAPYYRIVVADARTKRDGRAIEEIGKYHPKAEPSFIEVDSERAQHWLSVGAQPTDPVRKILEITGDWQKFKGLPGTEGTLRMAAPKEDRKEIYAAAMQEFVGDGLSAAPKGRAVKAKSGDAAKAEPAAKTDTAKTDTKAAPAAKADTAKADTKAAPAAKADTAKADTAKADTAKADTAKADTAKADAKDTAAAKADKPVKADKPAKQAEPEEAPAAAASADAPAAEAAGSEPGSGA
jgi:small subunit ribosomal protein S16